MAPCWIIVRDLLLLLRSINWQLAISSGQLFSQRKRGCKEELVVVQEVVVVVGVEWGVVEGEHPSLTSYPSEPTIVSLGRNAARFFTISNISLRIAPSAATSAELLSISTNDKVIRISM